MFKLYTDDYDGNFQPGWNVGLTTQWMNTMRAYYKKQWDMLLCPTATRPVESAADWGTFKAWWRDVDLPEGGTYHYVGSYSINSWTDNMTQDRGTRLKQWFWKTTQNAKGANNIPVFADSTWHDAWPQPQDSPPQNLDSFGWGDRGTTNEIAHFCIDRHNGWTNFVFMDWSVRHVGLKELWTLKWHREFNINGPWTKIGGVTPSDWPLWMKKYKDY